MSYHKWNKYAHRLPRDLLDWDISYVLISEILEVIKFLFQFLQYFFMNYCIIFLVILKQVCILIPICWDHICVSSKQVLIYLCLCMVLTSLYHSNKGCISNFCHISNKGQLLYNPTCFTLSVEESKVIFLLLFTSKITYTASKPMCHFNNYMFYVD